MGKAKTVSILLFSVYFSTIPIFLTLFFSIKVLFCHPCQLPSLNMVRNWPSLVCEFDQEGSNSEYSSCLIFFSIPNVFHDIFQLICCSVSCAGRPPSVDRENEGPSPPSLVWELNGEGSNGEYSSCFNFFPYHSRCFSWQFSINLLFSQLCRLPSLSQRRE